MTSRRRILAILFVLWVLPVSVALGIGFWVTHAGMIAIHVDEKGPGGSNVHIKLPAAMVLVALPFVPTVVCEEADGDIEKWGPVMRVLCDELEDMADGVLVEVSGRRENVSIVKEGRQIVIDCKSDGETVHVSLPIGTVSAVLSKFEGCRGVPPRRRTTDYDRIVPAREGPACERVSSPRSRSLRSSGSLNSPA